MRGACNVRANKLSTPEAPGKGSIAIFFWEGYIGTAPSLINAIRLLSEAGYQVDVITTFREGANYTAPPCFPSSVRILGLPYPQREKVKKASFKDWRSSGSQIRELVPLLVRRGRQLFRKLVDRLRFIVFGLHSTWNHRYTCFIGIDTNGLIAATTAGFVRKVPVLYWSLEIRFLYEFTVGDPVNRIFKRLERMCHRKALLTIIQDWRRADSLMSENGIKSPRVVIVPNGPLGAAPKLSSDYFNRKFSLPSSQRIILHAGMISPPVLSLELAKAASEWPDAWTLILHERVRRDPSDPYLRNIEETGLDRVLLSLDPVLYDELDFLVSSGDVGIVLYDEALGPNFSLMAGASGKLAQYLKCGLPVVCTDLPGFREVIDRYQCGLVVEDLQDVKRAIEAILKRYDFYETNAVKCYEEVYEFSTHFQQVLQEIEALDS